MKAARQKVVIEDAAPASVPQTTPTKIGYGHPEYQFVQAIMEMQKSLGEVNASLATLNKTVDSTKSKVEDITAWKNKILGGFIVVGIFASFLTIVVTKFSDYITIKAPEKSQTQAQPEPPAAPEPAPSRKQQQPQRRATPSPAQAESSGTLQ